MDFNHPPHIFWAAPEEYLHGEVVAIHVSARGFAPITQQSVNFTQAVIEYTDRKLLAEHRHSAINIEEISSFNPEIYRHVIRPALGETISFARLVSADCNALRLEYRWNESWLFIIAEQNTLVIARDSVPFNALSPSPDGEHPLL